MQLEFFDIPSPCISVCESDAKGLCLGCFRNREERLNWSSFTSDDKQKVIKRCQQRKKRKDKGVKKKEIEQVLNIEIRQPSLLDPPAKNKVDNSSDLDMDFTDFDL